MLICQPVSFAGESDVLSRLRPIATASSFSSTTTSIECFSSSTTIDCTAAGARGADQRTGGGVFPTIARCSTFLATELVSPPACNARAANCRRRCRSGRCACRKRSRRFFARTAGNRAPAGLDFQQGPCSISGTSISNSFIRNSGAVRESSICGTAARCGRPFAM